MDAMTDSIDLTTLPEYESKLLNALAFFLGRDRNVQGRACLSMYLRQSEGRIMAQARYYARQASKNSAQPLDEYDLLDLVTESPNQALELLKGIKPVHRHGEPDVFGHDLAES